jgi:acetyl-CoA carboxylase carboxyltransferase component
LSKGRGSGGGSKRSKEQHGWQPLLDELDERQRAARAMGGPEKLERQHAGGRLDARQRIERLFDPGSFRELGALVGGQAARDEPPVPADALVAGTGCIEGRPVLAGAEDFTVRGGSIGPGAAAKRYRLTQLAAQERIPLVMLLEGAGHRLTNALEPGGRAPNDLQGLAELSGHVPTVCAVMGPSAGHGALTAPLMDFVVMVEGGSLFSAGPPLVKAAVGETVTKEDLGGTEVHVETSGVAHNAAPDDESALDLLRQYLAYFPSNAWERSPDRDGSDTGARRLDSILELIPPDSRRPYEMREVIRVLVDEGRCFEVQPHFGASIVTALAHLGGRAVAIVANNPRVKAGTVDTDAAQKAARFLEVVGGFHLPVIFLADNPGVMAGSAAEQRGALRAAARMFAAQHRLRVPKFSVTLRKAFGFGSSIMAMNPYDSQTLSLAFPGVSLGAMPAGSGSDAAKLGEEARGRVEAQEAGGPWGIASAMSFDDVIDPRDLRNALLDGLRMASLRAPAGPVARIGALP